MKRLIRKVHSDPPAKETVEEREGYNERRLSKDFGGNFKRAGKAKITVHYISKLGYQSEEDRLYYAGKVKVASASRYVPGTRKDGTWRIHIGSRQGNQGMWFKTEEEMTAFIVSELEGDPAWSW